MKGTSRLGLLVLCGATGCGPPPVQVVARVGGEAITRAQLDRAVRQPVDISDERAFPARGETPEATRKKVLEDLIDTRILLAEAKRTGTELTSHDAPRKLSKLKTRLKLTDDRALAAFLATRGLDGPEDFVRLVQTRALKAFMIKRLSRTRIPRKLVELAFLAENPGGREPIVRMENIFFRAPPLPTHAQLRELRTHAEGVASELEADPGRFVALATKHSQDKNLNLGKKALWVTRCSFLPTVEAALFELKPGAISTVIAGAPGLHIVRVLERDMEPVEDARTRKQCIRSRLEKQKERWVYRRVMKELRSKYKVEFVTPSGD